MKAKSYIAVVLPLCLGQMATAHELSPCNILAVQDAQYTVCRFDPAKSDIRLFLNDEDGEALGGFAAVNAALEPRAEQLVFAMNGGMYHKDRAPVGLYRQGNEVQGRLHLKASAGNFGLLPNGVFHIEDGRAQVSESHDFAAKKITPSLATQSGPMLVIDGKLHPKFNKGSESRKIRNGVGVTQDGQVVFIKSDTPVNFYDFASLFRDKFKTPNALFLDGVISRLHSRDLGRSDFGARMGPIIGVVEAREGAE